MDKSKISSIISPIIDTFEVLMQVNSPEADGVIFSLYVGYTAINDFLPQTLRDYLEMIVKDYLRMKIMCPVTTKPDEFCASSKVFLDAHKVNEEYSLASIMKIGQMYNNMLNEKIASMTPEERKMVRQSMHFVYGVSGKRDIAAYLASHYSEDEDEKASEGVEKANEDDTD